MLANKPSGKDLYASSKAEMIIDDHQPIVIVIVITCDSKIIPMDPGSHAEVYLLNTSIDFKYGSQVR